MMNAEIILEKKELRVNMLAERNHLDAKLKAQWDASIQEQLLTLLKIRKPKVVHTYLPMGSEVDLFPVVRNLLAEGVTVVCPKTLPQRRLENRVLHSLQELEEGPMHTFHPNKADVYAGTYDVIIIPGLAFDSKKFRLGYGGGYYDSFLFHHSKALKVGAFYPFQQVEKVPTDGHDIAIDMVITP